MLRIPPLTPLSFTPPKRPKADSVTQTNNNKELRTKRFPEVRGTPSEILAAKDKANEAGLSYSEYARRALLSGVIVVRNERKQAELVRALSAIGNNLNQIARSANIHGGLDPLNNERLDAVLPALAELIDRLIDGS